jgi:lysophospholipase L1-like esterase
MHDGRVIGRCSIGWFLCAIAVAGLGCERGPTGAAPGTTAGGTASALHPSATAPPASAAASAPAAPDPPARGPKGKVLVFGDSITQADWDGHIAAEDKWVTRLAAKSERITTINAGKNGRVTSATGELAAELARNPDASLVILLLGTNDLKNAKPGVVERATANVAKMIDIARGQLPHVEVVVCSPPSIHVARLTSYWKEQAAFGPETVRYLKALSAAYRTVAEKKRARFIDLHEVVSPEHIPDGVHPNGKGQVQIADAVWKGLGGE